MVDKAYYEKRYAEEIRHHWIMKEKSFLKAILVVLSGTIAKKFFIPPASAINLVVIAMMCLFAGIYFGRYLEERKRIRYYKGLMKDKPPFS